MMKAVVSQTDHKILWAEIPGFSMYHVSDYGQIYNVRYHRMTKISQTNQGNSKISLIADTGIRHTVSVARLVAEAFVEPPNHMCETPIHLDGDLMNVAAYNLVWRTPRQAWLYARQMRTEQPAHFGRLKIRNISRGLIYNSIIEAGMEEGLLFRDIWESTYNGKRVPPHGFTYEIIK